ncbi:LLM class flavin-dependent oxidoreductase [Chloroflexi bacterium]|nr:LLM class flavin-dependent oxidoreductase [Chloroflexota bacterium]
MGIHLPKFGLNRHDTSSMYAFAKDVKRAESLGWDCAFLPDSQLRRRDTYVLLSAAAQATSKITIGTLLANPITRHPSVTASSISTVAELAPDRTILGMGIGDTAVRLAGLRPARIKELESSVHMMKGLLSGLPVDVGAAQPARLPFPQDVPIWLAAGGPKTLEMAGTCADGVFIRVGTDLKNIETSVQKIRSGAIKAGRKPESVKIGAVFHTVFHEADKESLLMGKSMAAGYYEYSPMLFENVGLSWDGADPEELKKNGQVWPDFHHASDLIQSGRVVDFLDDSHVNAFCLRGNASQITDQIVRILRKCHKLKIDFEHVVLQPIPNPPTPDLGGQAYIERVPREILASVRESVI